MLVFWITRDEAGPVQGQRSFQLGSPSGTSSREQQQRALSNNWQPHKRNLQTAGGSDNGSRINGSPRSNSPRPWAIMKKDMDLVREILLRLEAHEHGNAPYELKVEGYSQEQIGYHVYLMNQAGLLLANDTSHRPAYDPDMEDLSPEATPICLTWEGHEFLEAAREPSMWQAALRMFREKGAALTYEALKVVLAEMTRRTLLRQ